MHFNYCLFYVHKEEVESSEEDMTVIISTNTSAEQSVCKLLLRNGRTKTEERKKGLASIARAEEVGHASSIIISTYAMRRPSSCDRTGRT